MGRSSPSGTLAYRPLTAPAEAALELFRFAGAWAPPPADVFAGWGVWDDERLVGALLMERAGAAAMLHGPVVVAPAGMPAEDVLGVAGELTAQALTHATLRYVEQLAGVPRLALQDMLNVDTGCVLRNDDSFLGCNGDFATYPFTEERSVAACNGLVGDLDKRDCFQSDADHWYSARAWDAPPSANLYDDRWHRVAVLFRLNSIADGLGQVDGGFRYWLDGELVLASDRVLYRTGENPDMRFNQLLIAPHIGDGGAVHCEQVPEVRWNRGRLNPRTQARDGHHPANGTDLKTLQDAART